MPTTLFIVFLVLMDLLVIVSFAFVPYVTRKTELFGVSIPSEQTRLPQLMAGQVNYDDDRFWKLGMFYCNRNDPALFVEQRFGIGWTSNFARPLTWVLIAGFVVFIVAFAVIMLSITV